MDDFRDWAFRVFRVGGSGDAVVPPAPIRHRMRFTLEPVGEEWDGTVKPLDQMTYDPPKGGDSNGG